MPTESPSPGQINATHQINWLTTLLQNSNCGLDYRKRMLKLRHTDFQDYTCWIENVAFFSPYPHVLPPHHYRICTDRYDAQHQELFVCICSLMVELLNAGHERELTRRTRRIILNRNKMQWENFDMAQDRQAFERYLAMEKQNVTLDPKKADD